MADVKSKSPSSLISRFKWHELIAIPLVAVGVAIYWFRFTLLDWYFTGQEQVLSFLGLVVVPLAIWLAVFVFAVVLRRSWFRRYRLWLGSIALLVLTFGIMSFFNPLAGSLAWFSLYGQVTLGGLVGEAIAGPIAWQAGLRLFGIAILGFAVVTPALALDTGLTLMRSIVYVYVAFVLLLKWIGRMYRRDEKSASSDYDTRSSQEDGYSSAAVAEYEPAQSGVRSLGAWDLATDSGLSNRSHTPDYSASIVSTTPSPIYDAYEDEDDSYQGTNGYGNNGQAHHEPDEDVFDGIVELEDEYETPPVSLRQDPERSIVIEPSVRFRDSDGYYEDADGKFNKFWGVDGPSEQAFIEEEDDEEVEDEIEEDNTESKRGPLTISLLGKRKSQWAKPSIDMLQDIPDKGISEKEINATAQVIQRTLADYGVEVDVGHIRPGPTVTMYGLVPGWIRKYKQVKKTDELGRPVLDENGKQIVTRVEQKTRVRVDSILSREKDLSLALKTPTIRIETPVMGKSQVGIEVPNPFPSPVTLRSVMESPEFQKIRKTGDLPVAFGKGSGGETQVIDLTKMPHLLIAGATGSGKSVCLNTIVSCLIMENTPADLRLLLIDPKRVELTPYNGIPHLLSPVVVDVDKVVGLLKGVISEMMGRYKIMEEEGVRNIEAYNKRHQDEKLPFLVIVVDELADLMMTAAFDVEQSLCRLAQLGRATGIHLIVATQRPSVDVVTGLIKANFPSRVSFGVTSYIDSRTILDTTGAEKLLGKGDMLYLPLDGSRPARIQGVFISDKEIEDLVKFWQLTPRAWSPQIVLRPVTEDDESDGGGSTSSNSTDELFGKAIELAHTHSKLSTSLLQRRLRIGYPRAARLMDELEDDGVVGPSDGSKSRDVIMNNT